MNIRRSVEKGKIIIKNSDYHTCGFYRWYSKNPPADKDIAEILFEELDSRHINFHNNVMKINELITRNEHQKAKKLLRETEQDTTHLNIYFMGIRALAQERYIDAKNNFSDQIVKLDNIYLDTVAAADQFEKHLNSTILDPSLEKMTSTTEKTNKTIWFFSILGGLLCLVIARVTLRMVNQRTKQLEKSREETEKARKSAEDANLIKSDFLANMSHEIRTPMNAIIGLTELSLKQELLPRVNDNLKMIQTSAESLLGIINDILDFSKIEAGKMSLESIDFNMEKNVLNIINDLLSEKSSQKGIELIIFMDNQVPNGLIGDPLRLRQILINLTTNAIKFTNEGEVIVKVKCLSISTKTVKLKFSVVDTGIGLTKKQKEKLFTAFTQADSSTTRKYGGTGLGLAISKQLVEAMDGEIWVESEIGHGSNFYFTADFELSSSEPQENFDKNETRKEIKILVADDNKVSRRLMEIALVQYDIETVSSGQKAIQRLVEEAEKNIPFHLLLLDWKMEGMDGFATYRNITDDPRIAGVPVIMISAVAQDEQIKEAEQLGFIKVLRKPIKKNILLREINELFPDYYSKLPIKTTKEDNNQNEINAIKGASILLAEDNLINQQVATQILENAGIRVTIVNNGQEAVSELIRSENKYNALVTDIQMPEMDGYEAARIIRKNPKFSKFPIIAMTAHAMAGDREKSLAQGMNDHVTKPIRAKELFSALSKLIKPEDIKDIVFDQKPKRKKETTHLILPESLPGIDLKAGLEILSGDKKLFVKLLEEFYNTHDKNVEDIRKAIHLEDMETTEKLAHAVKGVAGNLAAKGLEKAARDLEFFIRDKENRKTGQLEELINIFARKHEQLLSSIKQGILPLKEKNKAVIPAQAKIESILAKLAIFIRENDSDVEDYFELIVADLASLNIGKEVQLLADAISIYDFDQAMTILESIAAILDISIEGNKK
jgi:two-component system, sensor histidine kinase and response regulator